MDATQFLPQFGGFAFTLLAFVVALSIIVAIHEYGHYIVGRWTGIHAEVFSLGFGPVLFARTDRRGTRWQVAALPFGGYVKFLGDANAASVGAAPGAIPPDRRRQTMLGAPLWARAATVAAGPFANFLLTILLFLVLGLVQGRPTDPLTIARLVDLPDSYAQDLRPGDEVLAIGGRPVGVETLGAVISDLPPARSVDYAIRRGGDELTVQGPHPFPPVAASVSPDSAAWDVGLRAGDVVLEIDGQPIQAFDELVDIVRVSEGRPLGVLVWRGGEEHLFTVVPRRTDLPLPEGGFETRWLVGLSGGPAFEAETRTPGLLEALGDSVAQLWFVLGSSLSGMGHMLTGAISTCNLSGPVGIAEASGAMASQGAFSFVSFLAVLSAAVGLMNLFPIPILDGGHLVFHAWEAVTGRPPGDRALRVLMGAGLSLLLTLMIWAVANDLFLCP
ncbi:RIP metalloprotease RseP [Rubellimicrobium aerolatum]|uniref:Zinc metalloprotease n=1 Tax=Rubellimicrobium aerolatum TaxID=490979 RepID=A0ABW0S8D1_9RHOB|nr:RIP metalloprotease RseP [Rubellimicrobium aerolatum]MBP1804252.1 regulator of sigma E protease [Rubellimicrobium aerolatum]